MLIRLVGRGSGNSMFAALFISNLALVGLLALLHQQAEKLSDAVSARRAGMYFLIAPVGFIFLAAYTESIFFVSYSVFFYPGSARQVVSCVPDWSTCCDYTPARPACLCPIGLSLVEIVARCAEHQF